MTAVAFSKYASGPSLTIPRTSTKRVRRHVEALPASTVRLGCWAGSAGIEHYLTSSGAQVARSGFCYIDYLHSHCSSLAMMRASTSDGATDALLLHSSPQDEDSTSRKRSTPWHKYSLHAFAFIPALFLAIDLTIRPLPVFHAHHVASTSNYETGFEAEPRGLTQQDLGVQETTWAANFDQEKEPLTGPGDHSYDTWAGIPNANIDQYWENLRASTTQNMATPLICSSFLVGHARR
jgi:hypothetical protein